MKIAGIFQFVKVDKGIKGGLIVREVVPPA